METISDCFLIIFLLGTSLAYNLCKIFFKKSLSSTRSESNNCKNSEIKLDVTNCFKVLTSHASFMTNCKKIS